MKRKPMHEEELEFKVLYWLIVIGIALFLLACIGGCAWAMWIITKVVTA